MAYPRQLRLDEITKSQLVSYLNSELENHYAERGSFVEDLIRAQKDYWAKPATSRRTFPFTGAADIIIPLSAIAFEAIHARSMTTLFGQRQLVTARPISPAYSDTAPKFELFMEQELKKMKFKNKIEHSIIEVEKFGTGVAKAGYERIIKHGVRTNEFGEEEEFPVIVKQGACADAVPISRFLMPFTANDPQTAPWCGEEHVSTLEEVRLLEEGGLFSEGTYERLKAFFTAPNTADAGSGFKFTESQQQLENRKPHFDERLTWHELWLSYDVDMSQTPKEIHVCFHRESQTIMSVRYNWYRNLRRPYRHGVYFPIEHRWTGIGICKQNEQFQKEVTTQHRQRLDNATLANMRMFKISKLSGYGPKEPIFPGKMWFLDDMTHVESIQMGEIYPSAYNNEHQVVQYSQQRTGVNEVVLGMPQVGTPGTATGDLQRIQEGKRKFDYTFGNIKTFVNEVLQDVVDNIHQFGSRRLEFVDTIDGGQLVKSFFELPSELISEGMLIELKLAGEQENKIVDRSNWTQIAGMTQQYYTALIQLAMQSGDQQMVQMLVRKAMQAATETMKQIHESFDLRNIDRLIPMELIANGSSSIPIVGGSGGISENQPTGQLADPTQTPSGSGIADIARTLGIQLPA